MMTNWSEKAKEIGFERTAMLDPSKLNSLESVRDMCAANRCRSYDKNWMCPPACGSLTECQKKMQGYEQGILLQTVGKLEKEIDSRGYLKAMELHNRRLRELIEIMAKELSEPLFLGSGPCTYCKTCAYPEPCRNPERAISSMEAYGLFVTQVCKDADIPYYSGPKTITYTACVLF